LILVLLDTNSYLRLAKRVRPAVGVKFGKKEYVLTVHKSTEDEVRRNPRLRSEFPWFDDAVYAQERFAKQVRLSPDEHAQAAAAKSVLHSSVLAEPLRFMTGRRSPPSDTDCYLLALGQVKPAIVVTDDLGMHLLAADFNLPVWHGHELLRKLQAAKIVDKELIRQIYEALETNNDLPATWLAAKHTVFAKIFGNIKS
jgi:hypothetical protein